MWLSGKACSILTGGDSEETGRRQGGRETFERDIKRGNWEAVNIGLVMAAYPEPSPQTPPWSRGGSWGHSRASFCLQWQSNYLNSASPPREAPELSAGLLEGNTQIHISIQCVSSHKLNAWSPSTPKSSKPSMQPVKQQFLVRKTGLSTLLWWFHDP